MYNENGNQPWSWSWHMTDCSVLPKIFPQNTEHGQCGSCSMVATAAVCSAAYKINTHGILGLFVQELLNELPRRYPRELTANARDLCPSTYTSTSLKYIQSYDIGLAEDLPYVRMPTEAAIPPNSWKLTIDGFKIFNNGTRRQNIQHGDSWVRVENVRLPTMMDMIRQRPLVGEFHMYPQHFDQGAMESIAIGQGTHPLLK